MEFALVLLLGLVAGTIGGIVGTVCEGPMPPGWMAALMPPGVIDLQPCWCAMTQQPMNTSNAGRLRTVWRSVQ
jgi:uncharacterized membrane protein YagU involved in acid resistance